MSAILTAEQAAVHEYVQIVQVDYNIHWCCQDKELLSKIFALVHDTVSKHTSESCSHWLTLKWDSLQVWHTMSFHTSTMA